MKLDNTNLLFLKSAFSVENQFNSTKEIVEWVKFQNDKIYVQIQKISFNQMKSWDFKLDYSFLKHTTGKFFSIDGIRVQTNYGEVLNWDQPIINQPEIGYLGFITKEFNGVLYFMMQAKIEPGNVNYVQLSPTLQATKSNYTRAHEGRAPNYLEYFVNIKSEQILLDQLQSEQGARFLKKRNRNIIIKVEDDIPLLDNYIWVTLAQIKELMGYDNLVNMDTRTVISGISYGTYPNLEVDLFTFLDNQNPSNLFSSKVLKSILTSGSSIHSIDNILSFVTKHKSFYELNVEKIPLKNIKNWNISETTIEHIQKKFFKVIAVEVIIENREVVSWTQPMVQPSQEGLCAFICKEINGILHFAVQAKLECGNFDIIEFAPTVQCLTGNYRDSKSNDLPYLNYVLNAPKEQIIFDTLQSEEGGRFYKEQNRNILIFAGEEVSTTLPENYIWMTLNQLQTFIQYNNYINIQARSLLSAISFK
jgi:oxidase EvaA